MTTSGAGLYQADSLSASSLEVAPRLLGAVLSSQIDDAVVRIRVTEVEAYDGANDPASHAFRGKTRRNAVMFGPAGHLYVYFVYGMHWCANVVCGGEDEASAVLLRAGEVVEGLDAARRRRPAARNDQELARGPARLASCLGLDITHDGVDLCSPGSPVQLATPGRGGPRTSIASGPRVGIRAAAERPWRFWLADDPTVSKYRPGAQRGPSKV
jgi:DNA-3-methyladenine glycosylase